MGERRHGRPALHAQAAGPTLSLLRLSAGQRLIGVGIVLGALWALVLTVTA